jgi:hypothetical protein
MSQTYPQTGSTLYVPGGNTTTGEINITATSIATNILITVRNPTAPGGYVPVGAVQSMAISERRPLKMVDEVGTDGHIDSVPNQSTNITGTCTRVRFDQLRIAEAFDRSFLHAASQVYPFDIIVFDKQKFATGSQIQTVIKNVWISGIDYTYQVSDWVITDTMTWEAETIFSMTLGGNPAAQGGYNQIQSFQQGNTNWIEVATDEGLNGRRGSLDAAGLIDIGTSNYGTVNTTNIY